MQRLFVSVGKYVQGAGELNTIGEYIRPLGSRVLIVGGKRGLEVTRAARRASFARSGVTEFEELFGGECSAGEIERIAAVAAENNCTVIAVSGGGKAIDAVKMAAEKLGAACVIIPTTASNDAPCSALSVLYNDDGTHSGLHALRKNPDVVLVDSEIIAAAPVRYLAAGMGDALATWYEAKCAYASHSLTVHGGGVSRAGLALARMCRDTIWENGEKAMADCKTNTVSEELENIVEANTLLSGLGFENCGVGLAHALSETLTEIPAVHSFLHGETVAFGLLAHMLAAAEPESEVRAAAELLHKLGLPVCLADLHCAAGPALQTAAARAAAPDRPSHSLKRGITAEEIYSAILQADSIGREVKAAAGNF
ncbi:MAG: glycerol dehydrogenase [Oscillospiraceae bacterium]|nr:glycerol dehydrogenase [Oscillospiraceae bacterium]